MIPIAATLLPEYENATSVGFVPAIHFLDQKYAGFRKVRRDGNCFYRAFLFSYLDKVLSFLEKSETEAKGKEELDRFISVILTSKEVLIGLGFSEFTFECIFDEMVELLTRLPTMSRGDLFSAFQDGTGCPQEYTWYMRLLTSASMRLESERFLPFLEGDAAVAGDMIMYLEREVEPMNKECEQVALSHSLSFLQYDNMDLISF
jgi:ubiquitin thioesterase protein OTUB1